MAAALLALCACDPAADEIKLITATLNLKADLAAGVSLPDSYSVKLTDETGAVAFDQTVNASETTLSIPGLKPGIYSISVVGDAAANGKAYSFIGNLNGVTITEDGAAIEVALTVSEATALLIKEMFYALGANLNPGDNYRDDNFYEIYNNSTIDQVLDGICIADCAPTNASAAIYSWELGNEDYVYALTIWQIPGDGTQYVLKPGESAIIAAMAVDHTKLAGNSVDLSKADFETWIPTQDMYADNPNVPNMKLLFGSFGEGRERWNTCAMGPAMVIFKPQAAIDNSTWVSPIDKTDKCKEIPVEWVIDAVEAVQTDKDVQYKRLPISLDAGATHVSSIEQELFPGYVMVVSNNNGNSVSRKIKSTEDGRNIYQDTNNSTEDFVYNETSMVRRDNAGVPSWSPAAK